MEKLENWKVIFKTLSNINRLKIIELLKKNKVLTVTEIANKIKISIQATSNHLGILSDLRVVSSKGKNNNVHYSLNSQIPKEFKTIINLIT